MYLIIFVFIFLGYFTTQLFPSSFPVGKRNASMSCIVWGNIIVYEEITLDIRQNKNKDFLTVLKCTKSGIHRMNNKSRFEGVNILSFHYDSCKLSYNSYNFIGLTVSLQSDVCILGSKTSASWRCLFSNGTHSFNSSEMNIYSIKGIYHLDVYHTSNLKQVDKNCINRILFSLYLTEHIHISFCILEK